MIDPQHPDESVTYNEQSLKKLVRAIALSEGQFSLILVRCNHLALQSSVVNRLRELFPRPIRQLLLPNSTTNLYITLVKELADEQPQALLVFGLEAVSDLAGAIASMNGDREDFAKTFRFPMVLWVTDEVWQKLTRLASDFKNWGGVSIKLAIGSN
jgi:hypothetical protein